MTGAASGIGRATAQRLAVEGMKVVVADIDATSLLRVADELTEFGHEVVAVPTDVSSAAAIEALRDAALDAFGAVHVVHNNAGVVASGTLEEISIDLWRWVLDVDLWSVIHGVRTFVPLLKAQGEGHIVNTASTAGLQANPGIGPYNVAKFGVVALSETLRLELDGSGVGVSVLCPGAVNTRIVDAERNRPAAVAASIGAVADQFRSRAGALLASEGLDPAEVASMVLDGVVNDRFWIITHPRWADVLADRVTAMSDGRLHHGFGG
ncbi:MAG: SDR family NAD(P)-dependent oxidoreductase [Actinomycetota bacterium]|nr:SDR family NAD(P)-dependent oxidoreductase [Actinomycetota bacterium]